MKRYFVIACEIMFREVCHCAARCESLVDIKFMPKKLHDIGDAQMMQMLQTEMYAVDTEKYDAILLCYGLCNNGIVGLTARLPVVVPRAHDCIALLMGSRARYQAYFFSNTGTFFKSPGWMERDISATGTGGITRQLGIDKTREEYIALYGEDEGEYLYEMLGNWMENYRQLTFIDTKVAPSQGYKALAKQQAADNGWKYDEIDGSTDLIYRLLDGSWDTDDFLVLPPSHTVQPSNDESIISLAIQL